MQPDRLQAIIKQLSEIREDLESYCDQVEELADENEEYEEEYEKDVFPASGGISITIQLG